VLLKLAGVGTSDRDHQGHWLSAKPVLCPRVAYRRAVRKPTLQDVNGGASSAVNRRSEAGMQRGRLAAAMAISLSLFAIQVYDRVDW
jgi:hypothetical protein